MLGRWDCRTCERDCEGNGYGSRETRLCYDCAFDLSRLLWAKLGAKRSGSWSEGGVEIDWADAKKLVAQIRYDSAMRCTFITDKDRSKEVLGD